MDDELARDEPINAVGRSSAGSEVVILDDRVLGTAAQSFPPIHRVNVTRSSRVHIGPKIIQNTQNVNNIQVVKGEILGVELVSPQNARRLRCSVAIFVCWALVATCVLIVIILRFALAKEIMRLDLGLKEPWYLRRADWQAVPEYKIELLDLPVPFVIIGHSALEQCIDKFSCIKNMLSIQRDHLQRGWDDIGPNFFVSVSGLLFEGRGANVLGAMAKSWNRHCISVMFLGNYTLDEPSDVQFSHVNVLIKELQRLNVVKPDYTVMGQCQVIGGIYTPGRNIMDKMQKIEHWNSTNKSVCLYGKKLTKIIVP